MSELAGNMDIAPSAASRLLNAMEGKQLITREVDTGDRRNTFVCLTPEGKKIHDKTAKVMENMRGRLVERMGYEDITQLIELWNKLAGIMEEELSSIWENEMEDRK